MELHAATFKEGIVSSVKYMKYITLNYHAPVEFSILLTDYQVCPYFLTLTAE